MRPSGDLLRPTRLWERLLLFGGAIVLIKPGLVTDLVGFAALGVVLLGQQALRPLALAAEARPGE